MARNCKERVVDREPDCVMFKPEGIPLRRLEIIRLCVEELEALRWADIDGVDQTEAASRMEISAPTFNRILSAARNKVAVALYNGFALHVCGGNYRVRVDVAPENE